MPELIFLRVHAILNCKSLDKATLEVFPTAYWARYLVPGPLEGIAIEVGDVCKWLWLLKQIFVEVSFNCLLSQQRVLANDIFSQGVMTRERIDYYGNNKDCCDLNGEVIDRMKIDLK